MRPPLLGSGCTTKPKGGRDGSTPKFRKASIPDGPVGGHSKVSAGARVAAGQRGRACALDGSDAGGRSDPDDVGLGAHVGRRLRSSADGAGDDVRQPSASGQDAGGVPQGLGAGVGPPVGGGDVEPSGRGTARGRTVLAVQGVGGDGRGRDADRVPADGGERAGLRVRGQGGDGTADVADDGLSRADGAAVAVAAGSGT